MDATYKINLSAFIFGKNIPSIRYEEEGPSIRYAKVLVSYTHPLGITSSPTVELVICRNINMKVTSSILGDGENVSAPLV